MGESQEIVFNPIGIVRTGVGDTELREKRVVDGVLEISSEFEPALEGIDGYSHLFLICYFNKLRPEQIGPLQVKPRGLVRRGFKLEELPLLGVFALDSPTRPNPIGLSLVEVVRREGRRIFVKGVDYFDGTPILDIKGYRPEYRPDAFRQPEWFLKLLEKADHV